MCTKILQSVPEVAMYFTDKQEYGCDGKRVYHERELELVRDHVEFTREVTEEDLRSMEVLRWLQKQNDFPTTLGYYVELARKFLIEGRLKAAKFLLYDQLNNNLSQADKNLMGQKVNESKQVLQPGTGNMLT